MKYNYRWLAALSSISFLLSGCGEKLPVYHHKLNLVLSDSVQVVEDDEKELFPEDIRTLSAALVSDSKECKRISVLDPLLVRPDLAQELSLATVFKKGGTSDPDNPNVINKLINEHFDDLNVPKLFTTAYKTGDNVPTLSSWLNTKVKTDSVLVLSTDGSLSQYVVNGRTYKLFGNIESLRQHMQKVLCENGKANFTVLYNPKESQPEVVAGPIGDPGPDPVSPQPPVGPRPVKPPVRRPTGRPVASSTPSPDGICDYETHTLYERTRDESGREQRGKVLVMNCKQCGY